jgi:hypothetical protein
MPRRGGGASLRAVLLFIAAITVTGAALFALCVRPFLHPPPSSSSQFATLSLALLPATALVAAYAAWVGLKLFMHN